VYDSTANQLEMDREVASTHISRLVRGFLARMAAKRERAQELIFIGMKSGLDNLEEMKRVEDIAYIKRKEEQMEHQHGYGEATLKLREDLKAEEGPEIKDKRREERINLLSEAINEGKIPDSIEDLEKLSKKGEEKEEEEVEEKKEEKGKGKDKGGGKDKKGGGDDNDGPELPPPLQVFFLFFCREMQVSFYFLLYFLG